MSGPEIFLLLFFGKEEWRTQCDRGKKMVSRVGFEPTTIRLKVKYDPEKSAENCEPLAGLC
ncbi:hypothetical protein [Gluconacetobacter dulcium]|nr:hypothetical protein [Gluconacetobacter dulcium]MBB2192754.1 hypothetical protein [Gluconacetobacter dulcium]